MKANEIADELNIKLKWWVAPLLHVIQYTPQLVDADQMAFFIYRYGVKK